MTRPRTSWPERTACTAGIAPRETLATMARNSLISGRSRGCAAKSWSLEGPASMASTATSMSLHMLWKGIARYAESCGARYLVGCSSLSSQDGDEGFALYEALREKYLVEPSLRTDPVAGLRCNSHGLYAAPARPSRLFRAHLDISGRILSADRPRLAVNSRLSIS